MGEGVRCGGGRRDVIGEGRGEVEREEGRG